MKKRFYVDTNIWLDFFENRQSGLLPIGEFAAQFFAGCRKTRSSIFYSEVVLLELINFDKNTINLVFENFEDLLIKCDISIEQKIEAKNFAQKFLIPIHDALHFIAARDNNCILITRDVHFDVFFDLIEIKKPEEVIF